MIVAFGNPLLDIIVDGDKLLIEKYDLELNNAVQAQEKHRDMFRELPTLPNVRYIAGGMVQNTIRVAQWMLQIPDATVFVGCVGADELADKMRNACAADGVKTLYKIDEAGLTGCCACLMLGAERAMCVDLRAAKNYSMDHVTLPGVWQSVAQANIFYTTLNFPADVIRILARESVTRGTKFCMNLTAATWILTPAFKSVLVELLPLVDVLFGNEREATTWADTEGWETTDIAFIALRLSLVQSAKVQKRIVVITQGPDSTIVAVNGYVSFHPIVQLEFAQVVCTLGAGDAYAGGFLAALSKDLSISDCCKAGAYAASAIVQHIGCTFDSAPIYTWPS